MPKLSHIDKSISRAEIFLIEDKTMEGKDNKVCEIRLAVDNDDDLFVHAISRDFEKSANEAIKDLKWMLKLSVEQKELPDEMISTVKV